MQGKGDTAINNQTILGKCLSITKNNRSVRPGGSISLSKEGRAFSIKIWVAEQE